MAARLARPQRGIGQESSTPSDRCVSVRGVAPADCRKLERLCRYLMRRALASERNKVRANGNVVLKLMIPCEDVANRTS